MVGRITRFGGFYPKSNYSVVMITWKFLYGTILHRIEVLWVRPSHPSTAYYNTVWLAVVIGSGGVHFQSNTEFDVQFCCGGTYLMPNLMKYIVSHEYCCMHNVPKRNFYSMVYRIVSLLGSVYNNKISIFKCQNKCYTRTHTSPFIISNQQG